MKKIAQPPLFTDEQWRAVDEIMERRAESGGIKVKWSRAKDERIWSMFIGLVDWALFAPVTLQRGQGWIDNRTVQNHWGDIVIERLVRVMKWTGELFKESEEAVSKADLQAAYSRLVGMKKEIEERLTNWEVCFVLMECSYAAPLNHYIFAEYRRAFARCFGMEGYLKTCNDRFEPLRVGDCKTARYEGKVHRRFPLIDDAEERWIEEFNKQGRALCWPGTDKIAKVG